MASCISVFTNVDFTAVTLPPPQDGFSIVVSMATPTPTPGPTGGPTATPSPSPSATPAPTNSPTATPVATPNPTASPTGTPVPTASATPAPTPSPTSIALCINVDGSTNGFNTAQLAGPNNGFSFANNNIANPTPTPTATSVPVPTPTATSASQSITGGASCDTAVNWPAYGSSNKYEITFSSTAEQCFNVTSAPTRTIFMSAKGNPSVAISGTVTFEQDNGAFDPLCFFDQNDPQGPAFWLAGVPFSGTNVGKFGLSAASGVTGTFDIWIV